MVIFNADLDNTLIYSYRREIGTDKVCVEHYRDKELSYMTTASAAMLKNVVGQVVFVPTTTRTQSQYERIRLDIPQPEYALVCNGGILLHNGRPDQSWYQDSLKLIADAKSELRIAADLLERDPDRNFEVRFIENLFLFTKSAEPEQTIKRLRQQLSLDAVELISHRTKIYAIPRALTKGTSVLRLKQKLQADKIIAAGDSTFDIPMLLAADLAICPEGLIEQQYSHIKELPAKDFAVHMLKLVKEYAAVGN